MTTHDPRDGLRGAGDMLQIKIREVLAGTGPEVSLQDLMQFPSVQGWALASKHQPVIFATCPDERWPGVDVFQQPPDRWRHLSLGQAPAQELGHEPESFADHPTTIGEVRSTRSQSAADWSPRDLLVKLLREHDSGEHVLEQLVVCFEDADASVGFWNACADRTIAVGLLAQAVVNISSAVTP